ncbi:MAG: hypothetical protein KGS46_19995 [Chloroflexi bacterium]|nr:hypothetical protein [Chloroflexota bacterium]
MSQRHLCCWLSQWCSGGACGAGWWLVISVGAYARAGGSKPVVALR